MPITHWSAIVEWDGPCASPEEAGNLARKKGWGEDGDSGLYCALGRVKRWSLRPSKYSVLHIGENKERFINGRKVKQTLQERINSNTKLKTTKNGGEINGQKEFWVAHIQTEKIHQPDPDNYEGEVSLTERLLLYTIRPLLDRQLSAKKQPSVSFVIMNKFSNSVDLKESLKFRKLMPQIVSYSAGDATYCFIPFEKKKPPKQLKANINRKAPIGTLYITSSDNGFRLHRRRALSNEFQSMVTN